jgi:hypothetical protein
MSAEYIVNQSRNQQKVSDYLIYKQIIEAFQAGARRALGYAGTFHLKGMPIFPSIPTFAKEAGTSKRTMDNHMAKMKGLGVLYVVCRRFDGSNYYELNPFFKTKPGKSLLWSCVKEYKRFKENNCVLTIKLRNNIYKKIDNIRKKVISTYAEAWDFIFNKGKREAKRERYKLAMEKIQQERLEKRKLANAKWQCDNNDMMYGYDELMGCNVSLVFAEEERKRLRVEIEDKQKAREKREALERIEARKRDEEALKAFLSKPIDENFKINYYVERKVVGCV